VTEFALFVLIGLEIKHFIADYTLQFDWMIKGKGSFAQIGGYVHAGIHAAGTMILFLLLGIPMITIALFAVAEFVVHYLLDFAKAHVGDEVSSREQPRKFWLLNGLDQFFHHLTYIVITYLLVQGL
jgi:hypothetical protein